MQQYCPFTFHFVTWFSSSSDSSHRCATMNWRTSTNNKSVSTRLSCSRADVFACASPELPPPNARKCFCTKKVPFAARVMLAAAGGNGCGDNDVAVRTSDPMDFSGAAACCRNRCNCVLDLAVTDLSVLNKGSALQHTRFACTHA